MKRIILILFSSCLLWTCSKETKVELVSFTDTGCGSETVEPATRSGDQAESQLLLEYSKEGLVVTRTNARMNCAIKNGGIACDVSINGNVIILDVYELGEKMRCICPVKKMTSTIAGLSQGSDYVLDYRCGGTKYGPFEFRYDKGLQQLIDIDLYSWYADNFE